ncbi:hypothetical protein THASP1DRAFT_23560 [Thamnocephalis sphaerospora]|uniref:F-box domain-containing protein n=1 Tax=Thamnocephalis sphaerospora TaxID=78915 RepID=A0A4P9XQX2_9FUNG|nr:hypothetical protein THASP1DRAFT_23560 [Thamnocephalis sphaerospora]|eukprot:RKP08445.1 hypothetical protein THASP1DRAFT_23560 [Thamnocephalis sphaerospora]
MHSTQHYCQRTAAMMVGDVALVIVLSILHARPPLTAQTMDYRLPTMLRTYFRRRKPYASEILQTIFSDLSAQERVTAACASKRFYLIIADDDEYWKQQFDLCYSETSVSVKEWLQWFDETVDYMEEGYCIHSLNSYTANGTSWFRRYTARKQLESNWKRGRGQSFICNYPTDATDAENSVKSPLNMLTASIWGTLVRVGKYLRANWLVFRTKDNMNRGKAYIYDLTKDEPTPCVSTYYGWHTYKIHELRGSKAIIYAAHVGSRDDIPSTQPQDISYDQWTYRASSIGSGNMQLCWTLWRVTHFSLCTEKAEELSPEFFVSRPNSEWKSRQLTDDSYLIWRDAKSYSGFMIVHSVLKGIQFAKEFTGTAPTVSINNDRVIMSNETEWSVTTLSTRQLTHKTKIGEGLTYIGTAFERFWVARNTKKGVTIFDVEYDDEFSSNFYRNAIASISVFDRGISIWGITHATLAAAIIVDDVALAAVLSIVHARPPLTSTDNGDAYWKQQFDLCYPETSVSVQEWLQWFEKATVRVKEKSNQKPLSSYISSDISEVSILSLPLSWFRRYTARKQLESNWKRGHGHSIICSYPAGTANAEKNAKPSLDMLATSIWGTLVRVGKCIYYSPLQDKGSKLVSLKAPGTHASTLHLCTEKAEALSTQFSVSSPNSKWKSRQLTGDNYLIWRDAKNGDGFIIVHSVRSDIQFAKEFTGATPTVSIDNDRVIMSTETECTKIGDDLTYIGTALERFWVARHLQKRIVTFDVEYEDEVSSNPHRHIVDSISVSDRGIHFALMHKWTSIYSMQKAVCKTTISPTVLKHPKHNFELFKWAKTWMLPASVATN